MQNSTGSGAPAVRERLPRPRGCCGRRSPLCCRTLRRGLTMRSAAPGPLSRCPCREPVAPLEHLGVRWGGRGNRGRGRLRRHEARPARHGGRAAAQARARAVGVTPAAPRPGAALSRSARSLARTGRGLPADRRSADGAGGQAVEWSSERRREPGGPSGSPQPAVGPTCIRPMEALRDEHSRTGKAWEAGGRGARSGTTLPAGVVGDGRARAVWVASEASSSASVVGWSTMLKLGGRRRWSCATSPSCAL